MKAHSGNVGVFVRIRPTANFAQGLVECLPDGQTVNIYHRRDSKKTQDFIKGQPNSWSFRLEGVLQDVSQEEVYDRVCHPVVQGAFDGYNGTVMCFGQTGAGKTYTMTGSTKSYKQRGFIPRALQQVFQEIEKRTDFSFSVQLSFMEIYNETLLDLLSPVQDSSPPSARGMVVMEEPGRGVVIKGLSLHPVFSEEDALDLMFEADMNRITGSHALNRNSSRSHCIFTLHIESRSRTLSEAKYITSKLSLVDLAGSERLGKTGSEGQTLKESTYINKSLSFLEQTILALADRRRDHVPFRQTKLTHALKNSLGGNCNTVLVANVYGEAEHLDETLCTMHFARRMKNVQIQPAINEHMDPALQVKKLQKELLMLKEELSIHNTLLNIQSIEHEPLSEAQLAEISIQVQSYLDGSLMEISVMSIRQVEAVFAQFKLAVQKQEQKVVICNTCSSMKKDQGPLTSDMKESDGRSVTEDAEATQSHKHTRRANTATTKTKKSRDKHSTTQGEGSPSSRKRCESSSRKQSSVQTSENSQEPDAQNQEAQPPEPVQPESPPTKSESFEDFKVGPGSKINSILKENKAVLLERQSLLRQLTEEINAVKGEIDAVMSTLLQHKQMRAAQDKYPVLDEEPDAASLLQLRELKTLYRLRHVALHDIKAEVNYCEHLVHQCRVRLVSEFETWYKTASLLPAEKTLALIQSDDTEQQQQDELPPDASSAQFFHNARCRTQKRRDVRAHSGYRRLLPTLPAT
ncbi:kinesin-like protein KIF9 isoform X2 [Hippoglossus hippoglossus]|uniref:kinesin-like protein KIF9 isoform X2 n=1 Tax=Hippoglossus hippoglossus TaxID=8267 RepID=UPI00148E4E9E|nr:kinesin-like protein KIF9 isoform X2 [Hippoglossus hippoglossus]